MKWYNGSVIIFVVGLVKCAAMSFDELQDFSNFLKETSLLDQPLKKNPADENDDGDLISDHAWEESGRFEGDLILNDRQRQLIVQDVAEGLSRNGLKDSTKRWPNNEVIFYIQKEHFTGDQVQAILAGIEDLAQASCVKFRPYRKGDRDAVVVQGSRRGCFSQVGYQGGYQVLNLSGRHPVGRGCFRHGTVVHEFLHTLGFYHMQSSPDRDDYIDVVWENIVQPARHNFRKYNLFSVSDFGVGYDYDSVLHYSRKAFSSNGGDTLVPKKSGADIGQRIGLSDKDTAKLNKMYCDADSDNFEAEEQKPHKPIIIKKKKPKNKPFEGHGIGYHQGKTVVIKLPAAETYRLPDTPSYHVFDYFSKAPQALSPTLIEGLGIGKKINYSYTLPAVFKVYDHKMPAFTNSGQSNPQNVAKEPEVVQDTDKNVDVNLSNAADDKKSETKMELEDFDENTTTEKPKSEHQDFDNGFHRIGQVIISRTHPDVYKPNTDYSEFYNPVNIHPVTTKTDQYLTYSPKETTNYLPSEKTNLKLTREFIETLHDPKQKHIFKDKERNPFHHEKHEFNRDTELETNEQPDEEKRPDVDITFGKIYPHKKIEEIKSIYSLEPEYTSLKYLENKQDYSSYYNPNDMSKRDSELKNAKYTLFGEPIPFTASWHVKGKKNDMLNTNRNVHDKTVVPTQNKELAEENKSNETPRSSNENESNVEENYKSDYVEPYDIAQQGKQHKETENNENKNNSYEVTEVTKEHADAVTEKSNVNETDAQNYNYNLEDRLTKILQSYTNFDPYGTTLPYKSEYDTEESSREIEDSSNGAEAEYE
ncbi:hypothetical protein MSG28_000310 [Choristoneura fumiferana]|uniref:Uncharacterized protein n=1 Tax=Choristoneura fumiferana TaxID=7141 RepID=A0ACC0K054_CHOFU|nr:hypothetical protein MSG28_000310 [Choristoneura fumiferana]